MTASFTNRYQATLKGNIIQIGNTLGLSKASNALTPGTLGSIGAFITTDSSLQATGWPVNTTLDYTKNSSPATLTLPSGATVVRAELIWSASYVVPGSDITAQINNAITFTDPQGTAHSITATGVNNTGISLTENSESSTSYVKSADVTSIVASGGSGTYICGKVPCTMSSTANNLQYAGWSLYVIYTKSSDPVRNIVLFVGQTTSLDAPYSVPANYPGPPFPIRIFYSAGEGDANITGDVFATTTGLGVNLSTAAQPANNPFSSQITDQSGNLLTTGIFGATNHNALTGTNVSGARQGWDIANNIDITSSFSSAAVNIGLDVTTANDPAIVTSNAFAVDLSQPIATLTKAVDKTSAYKGDTLNYTLVYKFTTVPMSTSNIVLIDTIPNGVTFQTGSVSINSVTSTTAIANPPGISLGTISSPSTFTITYSVTANATVDPVRVQNDAFGSYNFTTGGTTFKNENISNSAITTIDPFSATITQSADKVYYGLNDIINYTVTIPNVGSTLNYAVFIDTLPSGTTFVGNSFKVNGVTIVSGNPSPPLGVTIPSLYPNTMTTLTFKASVTTLPTITPNKNSANLSVKYTYDPSVPDGKLTVLNANQVSTTINFANLQSYKTVNANYAGFEDILTYTIPISNIGNVTANNIIFSDTIPEGTTLVANSLYINGTIQPGMGPEGGVSLSSILSGKTSTVTYKVLVNTITSTNPIGKSAYTTYSYTIDPSIPNGKQDNSSSNIPQTTINTVLLNVNKYVNKNYIKYNDELIYTISLINTGNITMNNVMFKDTIPTGVTFVTDSFKVNELTKVGYNPNLGVNLGTLPIGTTTISFKVTVTTVPSPNTIVNNSTITYSYTVNPSIPNGVTKSKNTNNVSTQINYADLGAINVTSSSSIVNGNDELTYTVSILNRGTIEATNVILKDTLPVETSFIENSVDINGVNIPGANIKSGVNVGTIPAGHVSTVTFKVNVIL